MDCKVSVIVPVYNVEKYLKECLESILNQTLREFELICVNDGSTDSSLEILEEYLVLDERVHIIDKENAGYGAACNSGLDKAKGKYISIIESDDFIDKNMLEDLFNLAQKHEADVVKSSYYEYKQDSDSGLFLDSKINWSEQYEMPQETFVITECPQLLYFHPSIWSCLYRREFLESESIKFVEPRGAGWADNPFQVQTLCLARKIVYTDTPYYHYRLDNPNSSSNIVNISNPFDRSDEVHEFLKDRKIENQNLLAHLYKREFSYIETVLTGIADDLFDFAYEKIKEFVNRMDKRTLQKNPFVNDYERWVYEQCQDKKSLYCLMREVKSRCGKIDVVKLD